MTVLESHRFTREEVRSDLAILYAQHPDGRECWMVVSFRHTVRPEFRTIILSRSEDGRVIRRTDFRHPRYSKVTKKNGWAINSEFTGAW